MGKYFTKEAGTVGAIAIGGVAALATMGLLRAGAKKAMPAAQRAMEAEAKADPTSSSGEQMSLMKQLKDPKTSRKAYISGARQQELQSIHKLRTGQRKTRFGQLGVLKIQELAGVFKPERASKRYAKAYDTFRSQRNIPLNP